MIAAICALVLVSILWALVERAQAKEARDAARTQESRVRAELWLRDGVIAGGREAVAIWHGKGEPVSFAGAISILDECRRGPDAGALESALAALQHDGVAFSLPVHQPDGACLSVRGRPFGGCVVVSLFREERVCVPPDDSPSEVPIEGGSASVDRGRNIAIPKGGEGDAAPGIGRVAEGVAKIRPHTDGCGQTLDLIGTAVAIFGADRRLAFHNQSYVRLWGLSENWLRSHPQEGEIFDRLRDTRHLPEHRDFAAWKRDRLKLSEDAKYRSEELWHLPSGKTVRVVARRRPDGGLVFLFDDVTEQLRFVSSYNALNKVHKATLNSLRDGVAIFGADGRLKFHNDAFARQWRLDESELRGEPHLKRVADACVARYGWNPVWDIVTANVAQAMPERRVEERNLERSDGVLLSLSLTRLPDTSTLVQLTESGQQGAPRSQKAAPRTGMREASGR